MGRNRDVYIAHGETADSYCGRVLVGLPINHESLLSRMLTLSLLMPKKALLGGSAKTIFKIASNS